MIINKEYNKLFICLSKIQDNNETIHILQDKIYRKFIKDICLDNFIKKLFTGFYKKIVYRFL